MLGRGRFDMSNLVDGCLAEPGELFKRQKNLFVGSSKSLHGNV